MSLPRVWEEPNAFFAATAQSGRRPEELVAGCIEFVEKERAHPPRLRRGPGIKRVVDELEAWTKTHFGNLDEPGLEHLAEVLQRLRPVAGPRLDPLVLRVRARKALFEFKRTGKPDLRLIALLEAAVAANDGAELEELHDRFSPLPDELRKGLLYVETRFPDLAEVALAPFHKEVQDYAMVEAQRSSKMRSALKWGALGVTVLYFIRWCG